MALFLSLAFQVKVVTMFAVIKTGGKQYVVKEGDKFSVEKLELPAGQGPRSVDVVGPVHVRENHPPSSGSG